MKRKIGIIKRVSCISLVFLLSINSFAAIVSDNDGAAFITKAEFDALKNDFQSQIDSYNISIDNKIDGAIASYLAGISLSTKMELDCYYSSFINTNCNDYTGVKWNSTTTKQVIEQTNALLQYDLTSLVLGRESASYAATDAAGNTKNCYGQNIYLVGNLKRDGDFLEINEKKTNGWTGWSTSRWLISGVVIGNTINQSATVSCNRNFAGFYTKYNKRGLGTQYFYANNGLNGEAGDASKSGSAYGNGLVASVDKEYKNQSSEWKREVDKMIYYFAPYSEKNFSYEDMTSATYSWTSAMTTDAWVFSASSTTGFISNWSYGQACQLTINASGTNKLNHLKTEKLNNIKIQDWSLAYGWDGNIKAGVPLAQAPKDGDLVIEFNSSKSGWLVAFNPVDASDYTWGGIRTGATDSSSFKIAKYAIPLGTGQITISGLKKGLICFMYVPDSSNDETIKITKLTLNTAI